MKRPRAKPSRAAPRKREGRSSAKPPPPLQYKVVELSTVDESSLERTVNQWCHEGWTLENVQFAMRESSKRPSMAFVFFTRPGVAETVDEEAARRRLQALAEDSTPVAARVDPHTRLAQLAGLEEELP